MRDSYSDWKVETREEQYAGVRRSRKGKVTKFVVASRLRQNVREDSVDFGVASSTSLVRQLPGIAEAGQHQPMSNPVEALLVQRQPGDSPNRAGEEQESVRVSRRCLAEQARKAHRHRDAGQVVVTERGMTRVAREEHFVGLLPWDIALADRHAPVGERRVDADLVLVVLQLLEEAVAQAEPPVCAVVRGLVRNPIGLIGNGEQVRTQLVETDSADGLARCS